MARARWIKPEFFTDLKVSQVSDQAALVFASLWVEADDGGVAPGDARVLYGRRFITRPAWGVDTVAGALMELHAAGLAIGFMHREESYVLIPEFGRKQGIQGKLKQWRHLGDAHSSVVDGVLAQQTAGLLRKNGGLHEGPPKPLAVAETVAETKTSAGAVAFRGASAQNDFDEVIRQVPEAYRDPIVGFVRAAQDPDAVIAIIRAAAPGGIHEIASWEIVGRAVLELRSAGGAFAPIRLHAFCKRLKAEPVTQDDWRAGLKKLAAGEAV